MGWDIHANLDGRCYTDISLEKWGNDRYFGGV